MPYIGIGTGGLPCDEETTRKMLREALEAGYRHIDTAAMYYTENIVGEVVEDFIKAGKLKREEIFITTKLAPVNHRVEFVRDAFMNSLKRLRTNYVDMFLIHVPVTYKNEGSLDLYMFDVLKLQQDTGHDLVETWKELEKLYKEGLTKAIGLSNFNSKQVKRICENAEVKPMNNQIELHVHFQQNELRSVCKEYGIVVTAFGPIGCPGKKADPKFNWPSDGPLDDPVVVKLAEKHKKTPAQILLRHLFQHEIVAVPKSTNPRRIKENISIFDFEFSTEEVKELDQIPARPRLYKISGIGHPDYPFDDVTAK
ncbi:unnamed protein product, partial [Mesorhabditis belari]|uniref:NADP-dependent oxidoreductase domain-containing protein n=1 Tax=Mesorhabditis belari TaxID=2138241 RepID=A0AAF3EWW9_9BILA